MFRILIYFSFFKYIFDYVITNVPFHPYVHGSYISSLVSPFPILFLTSPCLFSTYHLCYIFSVPFPALSPTHSHVDNPPCDLHFCDSVPVLLVCLVCLFFVLGSVVDSCECCHFTVHILIIIFILDKSLYISYNKDWVMMNSFNVTLSGKHFICPSILNDRVILDVGPCLS